MHHHFANSESQNTGSDPETLSGIPVGSEGGDGSNIFLAHSQPSSGEPASTQNSPPAVFAEQLSFHAVHALGLATNPPLYVAVVPAVRNQPVDASAVVDLNKGMTIAPQS